MSEIYLIDYYSNSINSFFHKRTVFSKAVFLISIFISVLPSRSFYVFFFIFFNLFIISLISKIPITKIMKWGSCPVIFTLFFALSQLGQGILPLITLARAMTIAFAVILFFCITPYPLVFSKMNKISPFFSGMFLMTYRFFFLIINDIQTRFRMMRVRGGLSGGIRSSLSNVGKLVGSIFISLIERGERIHGLLAIRGYSGKIYLRTKERFSYGDVLIISWAMLIFIVSNFFL